MDSESFFRAMQPYCAAFVEPAGQQRFDLLRQALTPSAQVCGPSTVFIGYEAISGKIDAFQRNWPDCFLVMLAAPIIFGAAAHFPMAIINAAGSVRASGNSVVEVASDGRIQRVLAFWGQHQPLPAGWPWQVPTSTATAPPTNSAA